jgi:hypothetical protein
VVTVSRAGAVMSIPSLPRGNNSLGCPACPEAHGM